MSKGMFDQFALTNAFRKYQACFAKGATLTGKPKYFKYWIRNTAVVLVLPSPNG